jgi:hypothetical protein
LSVSLRLNNKLLKPLVCAVNATGAALDAMHQSKRSPANYTAIARA